MRWITDENYADQLRELVEPFLAERRETGFFERVEGQPIYYEHYRADEPEAVVVISHGFTESIRKYAESIYYLLQAGFEVWGVDHRGHGRSWRPNDNLFVVHAERFDDYVDDLRALTETLVRPAAGEKPLFLFCHSMGGCVGARLLETTPGLFSKAVLSSPMLGLSFGKIPLFAAYAVACLKSIGDGAKEPLSPVTAFPEETYEASAANSEPRFSWYYGQKLADPKLQTCSASAGWGREAIRACRKVLSKKECARIRVPVLLFQAGNDAFVKNEAQNEFARRVPGCRLVELPGLRHELFMSDSEKLKSYWETIFEFYKA
ncbi:MAG: alpha/beta hydrolase [Oscillospiraceae bacterium]|nr:alpha/beta hydrolase [Oscillospiraceae bacterium]